MSREERLAEIRGRCAAATPGPWVVGSRRSYDWPAFVIRDMAGPTDDEVGADRLFIENSRDDIPFLLVEIDRLMAERDGEQARLRDVVVEAALAERRAEIVYEQMMQSVGRYGKSIWDAETVAACDEATEALQVACDALLAFLGEPTCSQ